MTASARPRHLRLGLYGGTFDPIHRGHLIEARDALEQLRLDAVLFIPCRQSPHKTTRSHGSETERLAMLRLAIRGEPRFWLSRCELDRPAPSYTADTAREIAEAFPHATLFWLMGADQLPRLKTWHRFDELQHLVKFAVLDRSGVDIQASPVSVLSLPHPRRIDISATEVRRRVKALLPIDQLVPTPVAAYIRRHRLYL